MEVEVTITKKKTKRINENIQVKVDELIEEYNKLKSDQKYDLEWEVGIDEAGRGPVLGPMVYGVCCWPIQFKQQLGKLGFQDSKELSEDQRDYYYEILTKLQNTIVYYDVKVLDPEYLSNCMLRKMKYNLNQISHDTATELIERVINKGYNVTNCYIDTVGKASTYQQLLESRFSIKASNIQFVVAEKADSKFSVVSAASICAKVTRDKCLREWEFRENFCQEVSKDFGNGYPSHSQTKQWLTDNFDPVFGYPDVVRFSWSTCYNVLDNQIKYKFLEDANTENLLQFLAKKDKKCFLLNEIGVTDDFTL